MEEFKADTFANEVQTSYFESRLRNLYLSCELGKYRTQFNEAILQNMCYWGYGLLENRICSLRKLSRKIWSVFMVYFLLRKSYVYSSGISRKFSWKIWCVLEMSLKMSLLEKKNMIFWYFIKIARPAALTIHDMRDPHYVMFRKQN